MSVQCEVTSKAVVGAQLSFFERYLSLFLSVISASGCFFASWPASGSVNSFLHRFKL